MEVEELMKSHRNLSFNESGKVCCNLTGHEMKADEKLIRQYLSGTKFKHAEALAYVKKFPFLEIQTEGKTNKVFCTITWRQLNLNLDQVKSHLTGQRFQREYERWEKCRETGEVFRPNTSRYEPPKEAKCRKETAKESSDVDENPDDENDAEDMEIVNGEEQGDAKEDVNGKKFSLKRDKQSRKRGRHIAQHADDDANSTKVHTKKKKGVANGE